MQHIRVWIVDRTLHMLLLLRNALEKEGFVDVKAYLDAGQVHEALQQSRRPDVIIADYGVRPINGSELLDMAYELYGVKSGILLVEPRVAACTLASTHRVLRKGSRGLHAELLQVLQARGRWAEMQEPFVRCDTATASVISGSTVYPSADRLFE